MQLYCCAFCSECVAADITIELITFQIFFFFAFCYAVSLLHNTFICNSSCTSYSRCERLRVCKRTYNSATNIRHTEFRAKTQNKVAETECFLQLSGTRLVSVPTGKPMHNRGLSLLYSVTEIPVYCHGRT